jgi:hypothetical protein
MESSDCSKNECASTTIIDAVNSPKYCDECIRRRLVYTKLLFQVWYIVSHKYNLKLNELLNYSVIEQFTQQQQRSSQSVDSSNQSSVVAVNILGYCRNYINKCMNIQTHTMSNSSRLCAQLFDLMFDIASMSNLQENDFSVLFQWTQKILSREEGSISKRLLAIIFLNN